MSGRASVWDFAKDYFTCLCLNSLCKLKEVFVEDSSNLLYLLMALERRVRVDRVVGRRLLFMAVFFSFFGGAKVSSCEPDPFVLEIQNIMTSPLAP